ncbi:flagellar motor switch protein FliM [Heyndrickxia sporothermodurans]|uniref:Flagellar motor switch protein FliM n=1 Tax=Heyndrickxia sporothermodurans TaxID=46224 RepID=A0AB37H8Q0_9BACI|nr:flagellar motor switch protein FliM [Heyndrickxia sporothermodurans]MBL5767222.1 flagellar motor switch protein FliM [Heyndrickxia sporothermodurans]MBL5770721.1 flagellar motor switch protein FliM [Heyndrickxia sporothermodurans]MBL5774453.1 flagellar motor switch protein FliM [Heyndrickxia sporothermodurans]MBL5781608.1 flagellar motor switch protein FliM [Heyndrickxia sporothermodurans]MBL5785063.1 flagellar motor switch protein FliM [Heyndrickxia sporothermodurans]
MSGEVLSQSEIDALLSALSTGEMNAEDIKKEEETKKVKVYDFKRALRFSKDQIRSLTRIHENFARLLTTYFSAQLRTFVQITVASTDQIPFEEFVRSVPKMTILTSFDVPPLDGRIIMEINPNIAYSMLDLVMGGKGTSVNKVDNLTEIEKKIMSNLFERGFEYLTEAWVNITEIEPMLVDFEVNPQFLQMVSPNETVVVISMNTVIGETSGMINLCIPHVVLEPIIPNLSVHYWMQNNSLKEKEPKETEKIEKNIKQAIIPLVAELGTSEITIEDFLNLNIGDVIQLDQNINDPVIVKIEGIPKYIAQTGKRGKKMAVQILQDVKGGEDDE